MLPSPNWRTFVAGAVFALALLGLDQAPKRKRTGGDPVTWRPDEARCRRIVEEANEGIWSFDSEGRTDYANRRMAEMLGVAASKLIGRTMDEFLERTGPKWPIRPRIDRSEVHFLREDGSGFWATVSLTSISNSSDPRGGVVALISDVTERRRAESELQTILDSSRAVAYLKDIEGRYLRINRRWARLFNVTKESVVGQTDLDVFPADIAEAFRANDRAIIAGRVPVELEEIAPHEDGPHTYLSVKAPLFDQDGKAYGVCGISTDITERKALERRLADQLALSQSLNLELESKRDELAEANARLTELATTDGLTSLVNRRHFVELLEANTSLAMRHDLSFSLVMLDIDHFKSFNDSHGHPAGDEVLRRVAEILRTLVRESDVVARYGGEEFIFLLPSTDAESALALAERLRIGIESSDWPVRAITASLGVASLGPETLRAETLIDQADRALYHSKRHGRNRTTHYEGPSRASPRRPVHRP